MQYQIMYIGVIKNEFISKYDSLCGIAYSKMIYSQLPSNLYYYVIQVNFSITYKILVILVYDLVFYFNVF